MKRLLVMVAMVVLALCADVPRAAAVTWGSPDGQGHPYVGLLVFDVGGRPAWRCSGTLLSPTVMVTAGHCTFGTSGGRVWFDSDVGAGRPGNGYPFAGGSGVEFSAIHTHPQYLDNAFYLYDVGVVILSQPVPMGLYGALPQIGVLDQLSTRRGQQPQLFNPVGYGIQGIVPNPNTIDAALVRYVGDVMLVSTKGTQGVPAGTSVLMSNHPGSKASGGTCFGDSGGPIFLGGGSNTLVAVTSFGINANCVGTGGGYRIDTVDDQAFILQFLP